jgi:hypothetical protein
MSRCKQWSSEWFWVIMIATKLWVCWEQAYQPEKLLDFSIAIKVLLYASDRGFKPRTMCPIVFGVSKPLFDRLHSKYRNGIRPKTTLPAIFALSIADRHIRLQHLRSRFKTAVSTARETPERHNPRISSATVRRRLRENGLRARRPETSVWGVQQYFDGNWIVEQLLRLIWLLSTYPKLD